MADWKNRIVGHGEVDPREIVANPRNWRIHPMAQSKALEGVLGEIGWIAPVTINKTTGFCLDGHLRVALAMKKKAATVPVQYVELTEEEEALALATLDPLSAMAEAEADAGKLEDLLDAVRTEDAAVQEMLSRIAGESTMTPAEDRELEEIDLERLPKRPVWALITVDVAKLAEAVVLLDQLRIMGARVEISNDGGY